MHDIHGSSNAAGRDICHLNRVPIGERAHNESLAFADHLGIRRARVLDDKFRLLRRDAVLGDVLGFCRSKRIPSGDYFTTKLGQVQRLLFLGLLVLFCAERDLHRMRRAEQSHLEARRADAAVDDHPGVVDAVDAGAHFAGEGVLAEQRGAVGPADLAAVGVAGEADVGSGGDGGVDEVGVVEHHEFEVGGEHGGEGRGDVGVDAAVLVDAD